MQNEFVINKDDILEKRKAHNEASFLIEKRAEALDKINNLDMITPDKTRVSKWDFFTVENQFVDSETYNSLEELPQVVREVIDIDKVENVYIQRNNTKAFLQVSDELKEQGVIVESIFDAAENHPELLKEYFMTEAVKLDENKLTAYHAALLNGGVFVYVPKNVQVKEPIQMVLLHDDEKASLFNHVLIVAEEGSEVSYVENYVTTLESGSGKLNMISEVFAKDNSKVNYGAVDFLAKELVGYSVRRGVVGNDATLDWALGLMNDADVIYDNTTFLMGNGSSSDVKIVHVGRGSQKSNFTTEVIHYGKESTGNILKHGVMKDSASSVFNGIGYIKHGATNADAQQESRVLMLSPKSRGDANPILLIDEDEVVAGHAASAGRVDDIQLFYLMSRGLRREEAERLVIHGFLAPVVESLPIESVKNLLTSVIEEKIVN